VVGNVYDGRVTSIQPFGAFVQLEGIRKKMEGLVHISQLKNERVQVVSDAVNRGQKVKVKVCLFNLKLFI
jgi:ATP-dependent RNA helicase DHX8/PRP22